MWLVFGILAILFAILNVVLTFKGKKVPIVGFISMAFTCCTLCACYSAEAKWVVEHNWGALEDVMPTMSKMLWGCTMASIVINGLCLISQTVVGAFKNRKSNKDHVQ